RGNCVLRAVQLGKTEIDRVRDGWGPAQRSFPTFEIQILDVERAPDIGGGGSVIIDVVALVALEQGEVVAYARAGYLIDAGFVGPGALRPQRGIAHVAGVVIVEVRVARNAKGAAGGSADLPLG